ncbi:TRAP transporter small permease [Salipiger marinus]|uniref:TRAP transporter small permease protein n=1 Tax=Salipiger marinus TaxID=555512 RepID=A0A1G8TE52_9RHOB|nr:MULTISPECIES: TRAP transporter small permease [Salipiger]MBU2328623.1 TRAP transporter small permease [Alphaproteobacteria bacterium]MCD1619309.1 TRAP transporter small permease [Salipiger manganoxidans]MEB3421580.1 TRAP transporter small permease [Salipiger manganoxidans]SDJ39674.1 TRAP-type C4-dicarboxylate transport system, small permease component [Salipiger marinus]
MHGLFRAFEYFIALLFVALVTMILAQIVFRYFVGMSIAWAEEGARYLFVWLVYLSGILAVRQGLNITFELFLETLPRLAWSVVFVATNVIVCLFLGLAVWLGVEATADMKQVSSMLRIPMRFVYLAIPIGCFGMLIAQVAYCIARLRNPDHLRPEAH